MSANTSATSSAAQLRPLPTELISPTELARRLNCTRQYIYQLACKDWFPKSYRYGTRIQRWDWPEVVAAVEANREQLAGRARAARAGNLPPPRAKAQPHGTTWL